MGLLDEAKKFLSPTELSLSDKKKVSDLEQKFMYAKNAREQIKEDWKRYFKLYKGEHWTQKKATWKSRVVENQIFTLIEQQVPLMGDRQPVINYEPQTEDTVDIAKQLNQMAAYAWNLDNMDEKFPKIIRDALIFGTSVVKVYWNNDLLNGLGSVSCDVLDIFDFYPDPDATTFDEMEYCVQTTRMSISKIKRLYGKKVPSDESYNMSNNTRPTNQQDTFKRSNQATVYEMWYRDDETGDIFIRTTSNGVLLDERKSPYTLDKFPYIPFYDYTNVGELFGQGETQQLEPLQKQLNKILSIIMDNIITNNNSMLAVDSNSGINIKELRNEPGLVVEKTPGSSIERLEAPVIPNYIINQLEMTLQAMQDVSGVREISQGITSQTSASGIQSLIEQSQTRIRGKLKNFEASVKRIGEWYLEMFREFMDEPRIIRLTGDDNHFKFVDFDPQHLKPMIPVIDPQTGQPLVDPQTGQPQMEQGVNHFDIEISSGSSMMLNKAAKYQQALELYTKNALDIESLLKFADLGIDSKEVVNRLIKYGSIKDPNVPQIDVKSLLGELGFKFSMSANDPNVIYDALQKVEQAVQQAQQQELQNTQTQNNQIPFTPQQS